MIAQPYVMECGSDIWLNSGFADEMHEYIIEWSLGPLDPAMGCPGRIDIHF
jgi:hypothetical protein